MKRKPSTQRSRYKPRYKPTVDDIHEWRDALRAATMLRNQGLYEWASMYVNYANALLKGKPVTPPRLQHSQLGDNCYKRVMRPYSRPAKYQAVVVR